MYRGLIDNETWRFFEMIETTCRFKRLLYIYIYKIADANTIAIIYV